MDISKVEQGWSCTVLEMAWKFLSQIVPTKVPCLSSLHDNSYNYYIWEKLELPRFQNKYHHSPHLDTE